MNWQGLLNDLTDTVQKTQGIYVCRVCKNTYVDAEDVTNCDHRRELGNYYDMDELDLEG